MTPDARTPSRRTRAVATWLAIYPTITGALWLFRPLGLLALPLAVRTLVLTIVIVPASVYVLVPAVTRALRTLVDRRSSRGGRLVAGSAACRLGRARAGGARRRCAGARAASGRAVSSKPAVSRST